MFNGSDYIIHITITGITEYGHHVFSENEMQN